MAWRQNVYQLVGLRLLAGRVGGYAAASDMLAATQTPKARSPWAPGMLSAGISAGNLAGPLLGGVLPQLIGIRFTFLAADAAIFIAFLATAFLIREEKHLPGRAKNRKSGGFAAVPDKGPRMAMLFTGMLLMVANMSVEPLITVYMSQIVPNPNGVTLVASLAMLAAALGSILAAPHVGRLADGIDLLGDHRRLPDSLGSTAGGTAFCCPASPMRSATMCRIARPVQCWAKLPKVPRAWRVE